ncbi:hypothetical protein BIU88_03405 [Chlorobaculum limnaeum]|uniref:Uncharacterized protein n=1 Tax=Chlorobaculum limnaeum TaxID=274537 RepID=A0A1D8CYT2_CHLLM|nr:hypothetical protein BIU88_03405 [Chlorobaculum limnaeum]
MTIIGAIVTGMFGWLGDKKKQQGITINPDHNTGIIVSGGNLYQGLNPTQLTEYRSIILQHDWEATKENPAFRKLVRAAHGGKDVEQLDAYSRAKFWEDLSNFLDKVVQADADAQKLFQQGSVGAELKALIPKIEAARDNFNYDEVNRLLAEFRDKHNDLQQDLAKVHYLQGQTYELQINYPEAERYYKKAAAIEDENPFYLDAHATILWKMGRYDEAEPLFRRALTIGEKTLGPNHPDVAASRNNLALLLYAQGNYRDAEPLYRRAIDIGEKTLGPNHPDVATWLNNLALLLKAQGNYADAEPLYRRALAIGEKTLGPNHPNVATRLNNLANLLYAQGKYDDAEPLFRRALAILEKSLGPKHPTTITIRNNLNDLLAEKKP